MSTFSSNDSRFGSSWLQFLKRPFPVKASPARSRSSNPVLSLPESIASWAGTTPNRLAVSSPTETLSYADLESQSNALARHLQSLGVTSESVVALLVERSPLLALAALATWKAGGAYLPLDPSWPTERLRSILDDCASEVVILSGSRSHQRSSFASKLVDLEDRHALLRQYSSGNLPSQIRPSQLAYVIYTSGSTGRPKGVEITHANLLNLVHWHQAAFAVSSSDRATLLASPGFDAAIWELWPYLASGATVVAPPDATRVSPRGLRDWMLANSITISFAATPLAQRLLLLDWPTETPLRFLLTGADALHQYPRAGLPFTLVNNYGPTECTVVALSGAISPDPTPTAPPPIGRPIANTQVFLLDEQLRPVLTGSVGELYLAGACVGRGYRNDCQLTNEKFLPNPFDLKSESRFYKTGDLARALPNGSFEFVGRTDDQIKIRGFRVEPNEISVALCAHESVASAVVVPRQDSTGGRFLAAYLILRPESQASASALRRHLQSRLPDYMIPAAFVPLDSFPVNSSGKVDRAALPPPKSANTLKNEAPIASTNTQTDLLAIVSTLLKVPEINPQDNFFLLGGHSLLGAQLLAAVHQRFGIELSLRTIFDFPTIAALSSEIDRVRAAQPSASVALENANQHRPSAPPT
jgi:amino acid adenylation domain-containing protein